jgi:hypothetical protein
MLYSEPIFYLFQLQNHSIDNSSLSLYSISFFECYIDHAFAPVKLASCHAVLDRTNHIQYFWTNVERIFTRTACREVPELEPTFYLALAVFSKWTNLNWLFSLDEFTIHILVGADLITTRRLASPNSDVHSWKEGWGWWLSQNGKETDIFRRK